ncbi:MAG: ATP-binding protein, partial [Azovibrio sp.]|nr:ATP-binding protein [Azovibrio sp.]
PWSLIYDWLFRARQGSRLGFGLDHAKEQLLQQFLTHRSIPLSDKGEFERLLLQLLAASRLIVVDDAHWLDQASARLLARVLPQLTHCLILITQRKTGSPHFTLPDSYTLALQPLSDQASEELLDNLCAPTPAESRRATILLARGVPIYLLTASREARLNMPTTEFLSATLNAVRASLPALGAAALLGLQWKRSDLTMLVGAERALQAIQQGQEAHILCNHDAEHWAFFHPLIHETILQTLPAQDREALAADAARLYMGRGEFGRAAPLWETAGRIDEARRNWRAAAESACAEEDALAACTYYDQLERLGYGHSTQDLWDRIRHTRVRAIRDGYGNEATCSTSREVLELLPTRKNPEEQEIEYAAMSLIYLWSGKGGKDQGLEQGRQLMTRANTLAREFAAHWALGNTHFWQGNFSAARPYFESALEAPTTAEERTRYFPSDPVALACPTYGWCLWYLGEPDWEERLHQYLAPILAENVKQNICIATTLTAAAYFGAGEHGKAIEYAQRAHAIATAEGFTLWEVFSALSLFAASAHCGHAAPVEHIHAFEAATNHAYPAGINSARWLGAEALAASGRLELAEAMTDRALKEADTAEHAHCLPSLWRLKSNIAAAYGNPQQAEAAMANAERIALGQGARGWLQRWGRPTCAALLA